MKITTVVLNGLWIFVLLLAGTNVQNVSASSKTRIQQYEIHSLGDYAVAEREIYQLKSSDQECEFKKLAEATPPEIMEKVQSEEMGMLMSHSITSQGITTLVSNHGLTVKIVTSDKPTDDNGNALPEFEYYGGPFAQNFGVVKPYGARRYDAVIMLGTVKFQFSTHYTVSPKGLTLKYVSCNSIYNFSVFYSYKGEGKDYEDRRAEKVGYDINGVGVVLCGINLNAVGLNLKVGTTFYLVSYVKLAALNKTKKTAVVDESFDEMTFKGLSKL